MIQFNNEIDGQIIAIVDEYGNSTEVHYKTICQYTGLKDKNGVKIFQGDILNSKNDGKDGCDIWDYTEFENILIEWNEEQKEFSGCYELLEKNSVHNLKYIEVIGNKFDNPELCEVTNE